MLDAVVMAATELQEEEEVGEEPRSRWTPSEVVTASMTAAGTPSAASLEGTKTLA